MYVIKFYAVYIHIYYRILEGGGIRRPWDQFPAADLDERSLCSSIHATNTDMVCMVPYTVINKRMRL